MRADLNRLQQAQTNIPQTAGDQYLLERRVEGLLRVLPDLTHKRVLLAGPDASLLTPFLAPEVSECVVIDAPPTALDVLRAWARERMLFHVRFLNESVHDALLRGTFDAIVLFNVSLQGTDDVIESARRPLRSDGHVALLTPTRTFRALLPYFETRGFSLRRVTGVGLAVPAFRRVYQMAPVFLLPFFRECEELLNELGVSRRWGTAFVGVLLKKR
jgi:SAM-dependent methyltransferase